MIDQKQVGEDLVFVSRDRAFGGKVVEALRIKGGGDGSVIVGGNRQLGGASEPQLLSGPGPATPQPLATLLTATGVGDAITLANGTYAGQLKVLTGVSGYTAGHTSVITPARFQDGTTITFSAKFDSAELIWSASLNKWRLMRVTGATVVA
jgi:hypothetical protein